MKNAVKSISKPPVPSIEDTIKIQNTINTNTSTPVVNKTVLFNKHCNQLSNNKTELNKAIEEEKSDTNNMKQNETNETKLYIEKKKKERAEKNKLELLKKQKFAEERKKKLIELQKTTRDLVKSSIKKKSIRVQDENAISLNVPVESNQPEVDLTWSPPPKVKSPKKTLKNSINVKKKSIKDLGSYYDDICINVTKNDKKVQGSIPEKMSKYATISPQTNLIEKICDDTKSKNAYSTLKIADKYQLNENDLFDFSMPKLFNINTSSVQNDHKNVKCVEEDYCHDNEKRENDDDIFLIRDRSDIKQSTKPEDIVNIDTATYTDIRLPNQFHEQIMNSIDHLVERQEFLLNQCLPNKTCSESTQTDGIENQLLLTLKAQPPPLNFKSVLKFKQNLQTREKIDLEFSKSEIDYKNKINDNPNKNMNNIKSPVYNNILKVVECDKILDLHNLSHIVENKILNENKSGLNAETIKSKSNCLSLNQTTENNVYEKQTSLTNNDELCPELNKITNKDITQVLKNLNCDFDLSTKNGCDYRANDLPDTYMHLKCSNKISNTESSPFHKIHDEFQAELRTLDQLNNSLYDIENMSCAMSTKTNDFSVDDELDYHSISNNFNSKVILNTTYSNKNKPIPVSKLNALSSNMMSVDKTTNDFSIHILEQFIKDEELKAKQHHTMLNLKLKSLMNRLKWEVTMCELQIKNIKNIPGHGKNLQMCKQKQRGSVKKLEHSLSQVKRLGRVMDSVYTQRITMLKEYLLYLRRQSSSKNVIRKLKSLDHILKKEEEYAFGSPNSNLFKLCDTTDFIDNIENEHVNLNPYEFKPILENKTSQTTIELHRSNIILRDQATSPINKETRSSKNVENIKVQTDDERFPINKSTQTSKSLCNYVNNENNKSLSPCNVSYENKLSDVKKMTDKKSQLSVLPTNSTKTKHCISETSNSTNSEQSDIDIRITTLQEQLEVRKTEAFKLKKEQKKLRRENLKAKEQELLKQIELYDKKIEESKKSLVVEMEKKNIQTKHESSSKHSKYFVLQNVINYGSDHTVEKESKNLLVSEGAIWTDGKKYFYPIEMKKSINHNLTPIKIPMSEQNIIKSKANLNKFTNTYNSEDIDDCKLTKQLFQSIESKVCQVALLPEEELITAPEVKSLKNSDGIQTEINNFLLKSQPSRDVVESLIKETQPNKSNEVVDINVISLDDGSFQNQKIPNISNDQELYFENSTNIEKLANADSNINKNHSNTNSSSSSNIQRNLFVDFNENDNNKCKKHGNDINLLDLSNNTIEADNDYSLDFTSDENTECQNSYEINNLDNIIELHNNEHNDESSYEEDRSEGDVIFEDKTFIEHFSDDSYLVHNEITASDKVDVITNNIFNYLLKDTKKTLKSNMSKRLVRPEKCDLNNLTEDTPLLMILKREEENQNRVILTEQAITISNDLFNRNFHQILSEILSEYLPRLNVLQMEKLKLYLNWSSSKRKKLKLPKDLNFQHKSNDVDNAESFEMFYQKYQDKAKSTLQDESSDVILIQTQQEAEKLKLEQIRIEKEIDRLRISEEAQFVQRNIPLKPPPPYKSPTKKKSLIDIPYTSEEMYKIVLTVASQLFNGNQLSLSNDYIIDSDSDLHADYKTLIFDYCKEVVQETIIDETNVPIWKKNMKKLKHFRPRPKNPRDLTDLVIKKLNKIINIDECEEKVNKFVVKQMHEEDSKWFDFQMDEMEIQNDIVESLMKKLLCNTITNIKTNFYLKFIS